MGEIIEFRAKRPSGFIPEPICKDCRPNGDGGWICKGKDCAGLEYTAPDTDNA